MVNPFRLHQQRVRALMSGTHVRDTAAALAEPAKDTPQGHEYAALRVLLYDNLRTLSETASIEARNPKKAEYAKAFAPWIEGVLAAGEQDKAAQDEILTTNMIWALDYRDIDYALRMAAHAIRFNLILPDRYKRTVPCFIAEDTAILSLAEKDAVTHEQLLAVLELVKDADMSDIVKARLHKAIGRSWTRKADAFDPTAENAPAGGKMAYFTQALRHTERALKLDNSVGVKDDIKRLHAQIKKLVKEAEPESAA